MLGNWSLGIILKRTAAGLGVLTRELGLDPKNYTLRYLKETRMYRKTTNRSIFEKLGVPG